MQRNGKVVIQEKIGLEISLCGKCIEVCPFTRKYLNSTF